MKKIKAKKVTFGSLTPGMKFRHNRRLYLADGCSCAIDLLNGNVNKPSIEIDVLVTPVKVKITVL